MCEKENRNIMLNASQKAIGICNTMQESVGHVEFRFLNADVGGRARLAATLLCYGQAHLVEAH